MFVLVIRTMASEGSSKRGPATFSRLMEKGPWYTMAFMGTTYPRLKAAKRQQNREKSGAALLSALGGQ